MSRKATTSGVERTGYALPMGEWTVEGSADGGMPEPMRQKGHGISRLFKFSV